MAPRWLRTAVERVCLCGPERAAFSDRAEYRRRRVRQGHFPGPVQPATGPHREGKEPKKKEIPAQAAVLRSSAATGGEITAWADSSSGRCHTAVRAGAAAWHERCPCAWRGLSAGKYSRWGQRDWSHPRLRGCRYRFWAPRSCSPLPLSVDSFSIHHTVFAAGCQTHPLTTAKGFPALQEWAGVALYDFEYGIISKTILTCS